MISVKNYEGLDLKTLQLLGRGTQGSVYKINSERCIKVFKSPKICKEEFKTLIIAQSDSHFPKLYAAGDTYIIREYIEGIELNKHLLKHPLTRDLCCKLIYLYEALRRVGYRRLDTVLFHIFLTPSGELKIIDTSKALRKKAICPKLLMDGLRRLGCEDEFLYFVKLERPELYDRWRG